MVGRVAANADMLGMSAKPPSNPDLLEAMRIASETRDSESRRLIYNAFGDSALIVPVLDGQDGPPRVRAINTKTGRLVVLAFTDAAALGGWAEGAVRWGAMRGRELASFATSNGADAVFLNPAGPFGGELNATELKTLAESAGLDVQEIDPGTGMASLTVSHDSQAQLSLSQAFSPELVAAVEAALTKAPGARYAYPLETTIAGNRSRTLGVVIEPEANAATVAREIGAHLPAGEQLDVLPLDSQVAEAVAARVDPIWSSDPG